MLIKKTIISARVDGVIKKIVDDSEFTHKEAYELGAKLIALGDVENVLVNIEHNSNINEIIRETEYKIFESKKHELENELRDL